MNALLRILVIAALLAASNAHALDCSAKLDKKTGSVLVAAKEVTGSLSWGTTSGAETNTFFNAAECVYLASGKAKNCVLGDVGTAARITPPPLCTMYVKDDIDTASCFVTGCVVGIREQAVVNVRDELCAELGAAAGCDLAGLLGRSNRRLVFLGPSVSSGDFGGLAGADALCQGAANAAGLSGLFKAWLSDDTDSPSTRFTHSTVPYELVTRTKIADDWTDLTDGTFLDAPINRRADGTLADFQAVWTGTTPAGTPVPGSNCSGWGSRSGGGVWGINLAASPTGQPGEWTQAVTLECTRGGNLYCFQQ